MKNIQIFKEIEKVLFGFSALVISKRRRTNLLPKYFRSNNLKLFTLIFNKNSWDEI